MPFLDSFYKHWKHFYFIFCILNLFIYLFIYFPPSFIPLYLLPPSLIPCSLSNYHTVACVREFFIFPPF